MDNSTTVAQNAKAKFTFLNKIAKNRTLLGFLVISCGIILNIFLASLVSSLNLPVFFDCLGTLLASIFGGVLPGVVTGFTTNLILGVQDSVTIYYGFLNVLIAGACAYLHRRHAFQHFWGVVLSIFVISFIGGVLGSFYTWALYGFSFGDGISAPFVAKLYETGYLSKFGAQLISDYLIDLLDKTLVVSLAAVIYNIIPKSFKNACDTLHFAKSYHLSQKGFFKKSLLKKIVIALVAFETAITAMVLMITFFLYRQTTIEKYKTIASSASKAAAQAVPGDMIQTYITHGESFPGYHNVKRALTNIYNSIGAVEYIYVYKFHDDYIDVVFDLDSLDEDGNVKLEGDKPGQQIEVEPSFKPYLPLALTGTLVDPIITKGEYGRLISVYTPIRDSSGKIQAYAAADTVLKSFNIEEIVFLIKVFSMLFGSAIVVLVFLLDYAERRLLLPIKAMENAASQFDYESEAGRSKSLETIKKIDIHTGNELESLYNAIVRFATQTNFHIDKINEDARTIQKMQEGIIMDFANLVEARDKNTGDHVKKTSYYVHRICQELIAEHTYPDLVTPILARNMTKAAPLHDIGKIKIPDAILNKPAKLTDEEFALMKTHAEEGKIILSESFVSTATNDYLQEAVDMAWAHHERWDGTGYPRGLKGSQIPLSARIMAVADVFDALVSRRAYKDPFPFDKAVSIIREESGTHFDPLIVEAFLNISESLRDVVNRKM